MPDVDVVVTVVVLKVLEKLHVMVKSSLEPIAPLFVGELAGVAQVYYSLNGIVTKPECHNVPEVEPIQ